MKKEITNRHRREASVLSIAWTTPDVIALSKKRVYSVTSRALFYGPGNAHKGKNIPSATNWDCGRFPTGSMWVLSLYSKVERHDTTSSLTPILVYSQRRQKKNINNCFSRSDQNYGPVASLHLHLRLCTRSCYSPLRCCFITVIGPGFGL